MQRWPHQTAGVDGVLDAMRSGARRVCLTSPTGGGKTLMMSDLIRGWLETGLKVILYTNRKMLLEQLVRSMAEAGLEHGVRASGYEEDRCLPFQVSSLQTEHARVLRKQTWHLHEADRVIVDEAHCQTGAVASTILGAHVAQGASYCGFTATPAGLARLYDTLVVAGTTSELRECGALVPCYHYGPDEPDLKLIGKVALGQDLTEKQNRRAIMTSTIFGRVLEWYGRLNPEGRPAILFAPGVGESAWFAQQFAAAGIPAAHIDGEDVWIDGGFKRASREARREVLDASRDGTVRVLCNRFVLREGIDAPWLGHGIFATVFGGLQSYLQAGGRLLRHHPGLGKATLQDHGGNWWRHGSLNADRIWELGKGYAQMQAEREDALRQRNARKGPDDEEPGEPIRCPRCGLILARRSCSCGFEVASAPKMRVVIQADGSPRRMEGDIFRPRRVSGKKNGPDLWKRMYYRARAKGLTFRQAEGLFAVENNWGWPDRSWPLMPKEPADWHSRVGDVPPERLT